ncbi:MarR family transcriptional regulator [Acinetobacter sp. NIPH 1852]|uniref:MarR family winged helix-turn-helix transcriptional regulator n=1 Tax=Acinetobacter sp. NIPH 1852 TaxID=2923428 RepID=UPI001F4B07E4|nr:MarR family transcriptional regulator [Acinetobacter sp. NIPH 1852]MCH7308553.1 MarR family transcriptional regulator [Acinetobacter sp. NIPH 1852]
MILPCYSAKLRSASRRLGHRYNAALAEFGINITQFSLLSMIKRTEPISLTSLAKMMELERSTVGRNVKVLAKMELVELSQGDKDQREVTLKLTQQGRQLLKAALPHWQKVQQEIEDSLGEDQILMLTDLLKRL